MKLFECEHCRRAVYFDNTACLNCGHRLGYLPQRSLMVTLEPDGDLWRALAEPELYRFCANAAQGACNWLVSQSSTEELCEACRHNATLPDLSNPDNLARWRKLEAAKHHLFYSLILWRLPRADRAQDPENGLAFEFLAEGKNADGTPIPVMTGHSGGLITLNVAEADDPEREARRTRLHETYRTLLGHFRHEIGHYYWDCLVRDTEHLARFRELFGDETRDYGEALKAHYEAGAPAGWEQSFITPYAAAHPWEDFAECWAHYMHIVDSLETAGSFGVRIRPRAGEADDLDARIDFNPYRTTLTKLIEAWVPVTLAVNSLNRSMGQPDLYPFVLSKPVVTKMGFIHDLVQACGAGENARAG